MALSETMCVLDDMMIFLTFVFYYKVSSVLKYFVQKHMTNV